MWYVVRENKHLAEELAEFPAGFNTFADAKEKAETLHDMTGRHHRVVHIEYVWSTKVLADRHEERGAA